MELTKEEYTILTNVLVSARTNNLQEATLLINLNNKIATIIDEFDKPIEKPKIDKLTK